MATEQEPIDPNEPTDPENPEEPEEPEDPENPEEPEDPTDPVDPNDADYRGKLNAQNRFLKDEGYSFNETTKKWEKPAASPKPAPRRAASPKVPDLTGIDTLVLNRANVAIDDIPEVQRYAAYRGISIQDALNDPIMKQTLKVKDEERATAAATAGNGASRRGTGKVNGEDLLRKAQTSGEVPTTDQGMNDLFLARQARKTANRPQARR